MQGTFTLTLLSNWQVHDKWTDSLNSHMHVHKINTIGVTVGFIVCSWTTESTHIENSCSNAQCADCHDTSRDLWPHLNITLEHYNERKYGIVITWEQPGNHCSSLASSWSLASEWILLLSSANVTGYVLLITMQPRCGRCGGEDLASLSMCNCINITSPVGQLLSHIFVKSDMLL